MAQTHQNHAHGWAGPVDVQPEEGGEAEEISFSEHVVRILVLGLAAAYTYILLS